MNSAEIFTAAVVDYAERIAPSASQETVRILSVEERAGRERRAELVRVPVFFAAGECRELDELAIVPAIQDGLSGAAIPIPFQADDVRRSSDGGVSRAHLWFAVDLPAGSKRQYHLVRRDRPVPTTPDVLAVAETKDVLRITTDGGVVTFSRDGAFRSINQNRVEWAFDDDGGFPRVLIALPAKADAAASEVVLDRTAAGRVVTWGTGPLFAKVRIRIYGTEGVALEQDYRITRRGEVTVTATIFPGERRDGVVKENRLLTGRLKASGSGVTRVPAGIRHALRAEHAYVVTALTRGPASALLAVPLVIGGSNGLWRIETDGRVALEGHRGLKRGDEGEKDTLFAYWTEVRLVPAATVDPDQLWSVYRARVQPLVAVVEEPGLKTDDLHTALSALVREMKPIGWRQEAGRALVLDDRERAQKILQQTPQPREADEARLIRGAENATAKLTNNGERKVREHEKGRAYGGLDPYHITYTQSAAAAVSLFLDPPPSVNATNLAMARAVRAFGGRVDEAGYPYLDCFNRTLNMQMGPVLFGLTAGAAAGETELARFYRDLATSPPVMAVLGRGQRPYTGAPAKTPDQTDYLYQAICDFWLRTTEVLGGENLGVHPLAYSRYTDCIDVLADRLHGVAAKDKAGASGTPRANFFRGQAHTHRWLGWSCAPYIRLLEDPAERSTIGLTEAIHHTRLQKGRWKNWPDLTFYILADLLVREGLTHAVRPELPASPGEISIRRSGSRVALTWAPVAGVAEYRIYRSKQAGGPYVWLNSPYHENAHAPLTAAEFVDAAAPADARYVVTAVDAAGRESPWRDSPP